MPSPASTKRRQHAVTLSTCRLVASSVLLVLTISSVATAEGKTRVTRYSPYTKAGDIKRSVRIAEQVRGDCATGSVANRPDAWRCFADSFVYDPCFQSPAADLAICPRFPGSPRAVLMPAPGFDGPYLGRQRPGRVWAIRAGRHRCVEFSGSVSVVNGRIPTLVCDGGSASVWGELDRRRSTWRALIGPHDEPGKWRWTKVRRVWR